MVVTSYNIQTIKMFKTTIPLILIHLSLISSIYAYTCTTTESAGIQLGKSAVVCLHFVFSSSAVVKSYAFKTTVDKFSAFKVNGLSALLKNNTDGQITVVIQAQNSSIVNQMIVYHNTMVSGGVYRNVFSFVVNMNGGAVSSITDDTANCGDCNTSGAQVCNEATNSRCYTKGSPYSGTDPRFFISWIGTDVAGNHMLSHTKRLSRFTQYSIGSIYSKVVQTFTS